MTGQQKCNYRCQGYRLCMRQMLKNPQHIDPICVYDYQTTKKRKNK